MKVLNCILDNRFSGPVRRSYILAEELRQHNIETLFLFNEKQKGHIPIKSAKCFLFRHIQYVTRNSPIINFLAFCLFAPWNILRICGIIKSENIDIVHVNGIMNVLPVLAATICRVKLLWHLNDTSSPWATRRLGLMLLRRCPLGIAVTSRKVAQYYFDSSVELHDKSRVLGIPVDIEQFNPSEMDKSRLSALKESLGIAPDFRVVGTVGNINRIKGYEYFLEAVRQIKERVSNVKFLIVGAKLKSQRKLLKKLESFISEHGLDDDIIFAGFQEDIPPFLSLMDVFVLSSVSESGPLVLLEAQAMKVTVVATDVGMVSEQIVDGQTGIIVQPGDPEAIADGVAAMLDMAPQDKQRMVDEGRKKVIESCSRDTVALRQKKIYEDIYQCALQAD